MSNLHVRHNSPFATPEKSPNKQHPTVSPSDTFGGKKGFLSIFSKKKATGGFEQENLTKQVEGENRRQAKQKIVNRKNIADGRIRLDVGANDRVPEDFLIDYKDNPFDWLDQNPVRTTSFIENLRSRDFSQINNRDVRQFLDSQQKKEIAPPSGVENLEYELLEVSKSFDEFLARFFRFFQGLWPGFCVIHLFLIFAGASDQAILESFVLSAIRIYQIFHVIALISVVGALNRYIETRTQYREAVRSTPLQKSILGKQKTKYLVAFLSFLIAYALVIVNHEFVAKLSDRAGVVREADFSNTFGVFKALSAIMTAVTIIGWFALILAFEEVSKSSADVVNYSEMTADEESMEQSIQKS